MAQNDNSFSKLNDGIPGGMNTVLLLGLAVGGYYAVKKIGQGFAVFKSSEQVKAEKAAETAIQQNITQVRATQKTTKPDGEWASIADTIYRDLRFAAIGDNKPDAVYQACRVKNDADFWTLFKFFGKRQETWYGLLPDGEPKDLKMILSSNLSTKDIAVINSNYYRKKMLVSI